MQRKVVVPLLVLLGAGLLALALLGNWVASALGWAGLVVLVGSVAWLAAEAQRSAERPLALPLVRLLAEGALVVLLIEELDLLRQFLFGASGSENLVRMLMTAAVERWSVQTATLSIALVFALAILGTLAALARVARDD